MQLRYKLSFIIQWIKTLFFTLKFILWHDCFLIPIFRKGLLIIEAKHYIDGFIIALKVWGHNYFVCCRLLFRLLLLLNKFVVLLDTNYPATNGSAWLWNLFNNVGLKIKFVQVIFLQFSHSSSWHWLNLEIIKWRQKIFVIYHFSDASPTLILSQK